MPASSDDSGSPEDVERGSRTDVERGSYSDPEHQARSRCSITFADGNRCRTPEEVNVSKSRAKYLPRSVKEKRGKSHKYEARAAWQQNLGLVLGVFATVAIIYGLVEILTPHKTGIPKPPAPRVIHLALAGSERKARFGILSNMTWDDFLEGCKDRFHLASVMQV